MIEVRDPEDVQANGMPWQVKAIAFMGVPSVIALFLVWAIADAHTTDVRETNSLLKVHLETTAKIELNHQDHERSLERILRAICLNGAASAADRRECVQ